MLAIMGGVILLDDFPEIRRQGVEQVFGPDTPVRDIVDFIRQRVRVQAPTGA
jgi:methylmalonyl-CoA mutase, C-terminal domain